MFTVREQIDFFCFSTIFEKTPDSEQACLKKILSESLEPAATE